MCFRPLLQRFKEKGMRILSLQSIPLLWFSSLHSVFGRRLRNRITFLSSKGKDEKLASFPSSHYISFVLTDKGVEILTSIEDALTMTSVVRTRAPRPWLFKRWIALSIG